jgi:hypothetical protein
MQGVRASTSMSRIWHHLPRSKRRQQTKQLQHNRLLERREIYRHEPVHPADRRGDACGYQKPIVAAAGKPLDRQIDPGALSPSLG